MIKKINDHTAVIDGKLRVIWLKGGKHFILQDTSGGSISLSGDDTRALLVETIKLIDRLEAEKSKDR